MELDKELKIRLDQNTYEKTMIVIYDNASIHKTKKVRIIIKRQKWVVFTIPSYSPELNQIQHTFGILKVRIYKRNFNIKEFKDHKRSNNKVKMIKNIYNQIITKIKIKSLF